MTGIAGDSYGSQAIPVPVPATQSNAVGDPFLDTIGAFFKAVTNANAGAAWAKVSPVLGQSLPIQQVFAYDPRQGGFQENRLPALYLWREGVSQRQQLAQDIRVAVSAIAFLWILPWETNQDKQVLRFPFPQSLFNVMDDALEAGRDPSWIVPGDSDPTAATYGSAIEAFVDVQRMHFVKWVPTTIDIPNDTEKRAYPAALGQLYVEEVLTIGQSKGYPNTQSDAKVTVTDQGFGDGGYVAAEAILTGS